MYDRVGGTPFFDELTKRFYEGVAADPVLAPLYPSDPDEFEQARVNLLWFLVQYWGGPATYSEERGHPKLRLRHAPFVIGAAERDAWLAHMTEAVRAAGLSPLDEAQMLTYFQASAAHMVNAAE
ncbi:globin [Acidiferrimicrobium sp. IK]|nr:globin [Acidiferrimicrobium sp. IK]